MRRACKKIYSSAVAHLCVGTQYTCTHGEAAAAAAAAAAEAASNLEQQSNSQSNCHNDVASTSQEVNEVSTKKFHVSHVTVSVVVVRVVVCLSSSGVVMR